PAVALVVAIAAAGTWLFTHRATPEKQLQFAIPVQGEISHVALSADGSMLAFVSPDESTGIPMIYLQQIGSADVRALPGTEGATYPFWSPDGAYIGFFAKGKLQKLAIAGGSPQVLAKVWAARGGTWGKGDIILYEP